jgi:hypothetical protein
VEIATLPFNVEVVRKSLKVVEHIGGMELVAEACNTAAAFEAITRVVDATNRVEPPQVMLHMLKYVNFVGSNMPSLKSLLALVVPVIVATIVIKLWNN